MTRLIALALLSLAAALPARAQAPETPTDVFARALDLRPLSVTAVHFEGRLTSFDSFAYKLMKRVTGARGLDGRSHVFTLLDMSLRPNAYAATDSVYVRKKPMRQSIARALASRSDYPDARLAAFLDTGLISRQVLLTDPNVRELLARLSANTVSTAKHVEELETALALSDASILLEQTRLIPPPSGSPDQPWRTMLDLFAHAETESGDIDGLSPEQAQRLKAAWATVAQAWAMHAVPGEDPARHAATASAALADLAAELPTIAPDLYPARARLAWESWYFAQGHLTWVWIIYMLAVALLLMAVVYKWPAARALGLGVFLAAAALHTAAVMLRWYVSGHWPNSNMFEAVTTAAWMGAVGAIAIELLARKTAMRNLFALAASVSAAVALMCAHFMPVSLSPELSNRMPILHDLWLYIHTNVIIFSYILIAMAAATSLGYVALRLLGAKPDYARGGGAGTLVGMGAASMSDLAQRKPSAPAVLDGATMILMELAFVLLWAGIIMGAIWADHSWGRPWGWDPKEVFALNTFIVFVILVHVRLKTSDKGLWTALLALAGCAVMVFNWVVINFIISGLHSYA